MANLKDLKVRIKSVKSTQKITRAMKVVSASKLRRARDKVEAATPYAERMARMLATLAGNVNSESAPALLVGNGKEQTHLLVIIGSDRGLCGGLNGSLVKLLKRNIQELKQAGKEVRLFCIGKKVYELLTPYKSLILHHVEGITKQKSIPYEDIAVQAERLITLFESGQYDVCTVYYNQFLSAISQKPTQQQLIPLYVQENEALESNQKALAQYEYEPSEEAILADLLPRNLAVQLYRAILENVASEQGARMTAMDNATRNAGDMIKKLTLVYNRTRQAVITKELIEIISGAEAV